MGDSLSVIFATIVAAIVMFLFPMVDTWERQDDLSYVTAYTAVVDVVDSVRNTGRLTWDMYSSLVRTLNATGNRFDIKMEHREAVVVPSGDTGTDIVMVYRNHYTSDILNNYLRSGDHEYKLFRKGDYFFISVKNTNKTQATVLKQNLYASPIETFKIGIPYGGMVRNTYDYNL